MERTQLLHHAELRRSCLGGTNVRGSSSLVAPPEKSCLWSCYIFSTSVASFFLSFFCMYSLPFLASHYCFPGYITKQKSKLLLRNYLCKILSRHNFLLLTVGLCLPVFFGYEAQNMAEGEPVLREKTFPELEQDLKERGFNSTMALRRCYCSSYSSHFPMDY